MAEEQRKAEPDTIETGSCPQSEFLRSLSAEELARRSQRGCRASFAELVERYGIRLFKFLRYKTASFQDTEDLVQDTFVKAYENIHRYRDSWKFSTWLFTIAARLAYSHFRRSRSFRTVGEVESGGPEPGQTIAEQETQQSLWAMAGDLSRNQYQALWLKYGQDMSIKEISDVMRKSQVNVKVLLYRARVNLAKRVQKVTEEKETAEETPSKEMLSFMKVEGA
jgi:RNA polymerase sigma-70 factor (ECF subfamily)